MPDRVFFKFGSYNLTPYLNIQDFDINAVDEYTEWIDGNYNLHRDVSRSRRQGKIVAGFKTEASYNAFLTALSTEKDPGGTYQNFKGFYNVESWVNNAGSATATQTYRAYMTPTGSAKWDLIDGRLWITQELTVTEL